MLRGNVVQNIFFTLEDYNYLYFLIQIGIERYHHKVQAFCCMDNHLHLHIEVSNVPLSKIIQNLSFRYTRWINSKTNRVDHLFSGRYKAILRDKEAYLLQLISYTFKSSKSKFNTR